MSNKFNKEKLRGFYADLTSYILLSFILLILGAFIGSYTLLFFVVIVWGAVLIVQANNVGFIFKPGKTLSFLQKSEFLKSALPFLNEDWDGKKIFGDSIERDVKRAEKTVVKKAEKFVKVAEIDLEKALKKVEKKTKTKKGAVKKAEKFVETIAEDIEKSLKKAEKKIKKSTPSKKVAPKKTKTAVAAKKKTASSSKPAKAPKAAAKAKAKSKTAAPVTKKVAEVAAKKK